MRRGEGPAQIFVTLFIIIKYFHFDYLNTPLMKIVGQVRHQWYNRWDEKLFENSLMLRSVHLRHAHDIVLKTSV